MNNDALLPLLLRLIDARAEGTISGPTVDFKIDELTGRCITRGEIIG